MGRLTGAAQQVGAGDLDVQVREEEGDDEIAMLGRYFNQMTKQLKGQRNTLLDNTRHIERRRRLFDSVLSSVTSGVVVADWIFTTPAIVIQFVTGVWLSRYLNIAYDSKWFIAVISLYVFVGICWLPVVWIQMRVHKLVTAGAGRASYEKLMRAWIALGVPAFASVIVLIFLMVSKLGAYD